MIITSLKIKAHTNQEINPPLENQMVFMFLIDGKEKGFTMSPKSLFEVLEANMKDNKGTPIVFSPKGVERFLKTLP